MTITREQVADLQPGDVVELSNDTWHGAVVRGPVHNMETGYLCVGEYAIARPDGQPYGGDRNHVLTVVSRAPRPLYVNHPRTSPVPGDVVRDADGGNARTWYRPDDHGFLWRRTDGSSAESGYVRRELPDRLRLLVDGETGQAVQ